MNLEHNKVELLAPAGDIDCFYAAINAGADAVYMGLQRFGARAGAKNLTSDELKKALTVAHVLDRKIYLTVNTLFKDREIEELYDLLYDAYIYGLHGVIVQDIGVMSYINRQFPDLPIHVSTQAGITSSDGVSMLKSLGVKRIVPARELNLSEIKQLKEESHLEIECFVHGSLCYSYSGKCLLSSFIGGRSGNRGRCAQPCRLMYDNTYPLSMKDLCTIDLIPDLIRAGIDSFKIEGRMKSAEYVYDVTSIYRKYIDKYYAGDVYNVSDNDRRDLISIYTRSGNCDGYYRHHNGRDMITPESPSYLRSSEETKNRDIVSEPSCDVNISCTIKQNAPVKITVSDDRYSVTVSTLKVADKAVSRALSVNDVNKQLIKSGGTSFNVKDINTELDDDLFLPVSSLNEIRRAGLDAFAEEITAHHTRVDVKRINCDVCAESIADVIFPEVNVSIDQADQLGPALDSPADAVTIPLYLFERLSRDKRFDLSKKKIYIKLPYIIREEERSAGRRRIGEFVKDITDRYRIAGFLVSNNESVGILRKLGYNGLIIGDVFLYVANRLAYDHYLTSGVDRTTVPVELNIHELKNRGITGEELMIYGRIPVMISANCVLNTLKGCNRRDGGNTAYLTDRKGENLFVLCDCDSCTNTIYNSAILSVADEKDLFETVRPSSVRLSFTDEDEHTTREVLQTYFTNRQKGGYTSVKLIDKYTKGHIKRGVD